MNRDEPSLLLTDLHGRRIYCTDPIKRTNELIKEGRIIAIKGIGGFHLCCDATNSGSVDLLRRRKNRPHKPLAVMAGSIDTVSKYCEISEKELEILVCSKRPIVLLRKKEIFTLPDNVAPNQKRLGIMLPYSSIHSSLFSTNTELLVMTSGNIGGGTIQYDNDNAIRYLKGIADYFLLHDRDINNPIDDSLIRVIAEKEMVSRRGRGYIPYAQSINAAEGILALGAEQKSTICLSQNGYAHLSQYLGDLKNMSAYELYKRTVAKMTDSLQLKPKVYVHDIHPQYLSTRYAMQQQGRKVAVQHHHAHMVSCMVEHNLFNKAIGVVFDGTGLGNDGSIWGGEFFIGDRRSYQRVGHLKPVLLQGGDMSVKEPWRSAASYLYSLGYNPQKYLEAVGSEEIDIVRQAITSNFNCYRSSSMGRLFDCAAALTGIRQHITYDAQGAIELENVIDPSIDDTSYSYRIYNNNSDLELDFEGIIAGLLKDKKCKTPVSVMSAKFHNTIIHASVEMVIALRKKYEVNQIVLSGGVFENTYLLESINKKLRGEGFNVYFNEQIPTNDSGISVGQLVIANETIGE